MQCKGQTAVYNKPKLNEDDNKCMEKDAPRMQRVTWSYFW